MPNGEANITNTVLEIMHADRHTVGHYKCTADNRVGQPDQRDIFVNVLCKYPDGKMGLCCPIAWLCSIEYTLSPFCGNIAFALYSNRIETV